MSARFFGPLAGLFLLTAPLAAMAAAAPDQLPAEVQGVVGSGDQLSLQLRWAEGERTLKPGETYRDGWVLQSLTPTKASLSKDGQVREVGLNPTGALAAAASAAPPSLVTVSLSPEEIAELRVVAGSPIWDGRPMLGLSQEETQRFVLDAIRMRAAVLASGKEAQAVALLGQVAYDQHQAASQKIFMAPPPGPSSLYVPPDTSINIAAKEAGVNMRGGWTITATPDGGRMMVRNDTTGDPRLAQIEASNWATSLLNMVRQSGLQP